MSEIMNIKSEDLSNLQETNYAMRIRNIIEKAELYGPVRLRILLTPDISTTLLISCEQEKVRPSTAYFLAQDYLSYSYPLRVESYDIWCDGSEIQCALCFDLSAVQDALKNSSIILESVAPFGWYVANFLRARGQIASMCLVENYFWALDQYSFFELIMPRDWHSLEQDLAETNFKLLLHDSFGKQNVDNKQPCQTHSAKDMITRLRKIVPDCHCEALAMPDIIQPQTDEQSPELDELSCLALRILIQVEKCTAIRLVPKQCQLLQIC